MVFSYYNRLNASQKRIYRKSNEIGAVPLPNASDLHPLVLNLAGALEREDRAKTEYFCQKLAAGISAGLTAPPVRVTVLAARPSASWGELHGLYVPAQGRTSAVITVWMRTAQRHQVVAFRSFLRTLLHELCHHLDYELFKLPDSFHTEGFYKRESSLFHQLMRRGEA
jgi:hypothetical protein